MKLPLDIPAASISCKLCTGVLFRFLYVGELAYHWMRELLIHAREIHTREIVIRPIATLLS